MVLLKVVDLRENFETDLATDAIQRLLDASEEQIIRKFGPHTTAVTDEMPGLSKFIFPSRPIVTVTTITETVDTVDTVLAVDDYKLIHSGRQIERLADGTNSRKLWGDRVKLVYVPDDQTKIRKGVQVDLVKLAIQYEAFTTLKSGNFDADFPEYEKERMTIIERLRRGVAFV